MLLGLPEAKKDRVIGDSTNLSEEWNKTKHTSLDFRDYFDISPYTDDVSYVKALAQCSAPEVKEICCELIKEKTKK